MSSITFCRKCHREAYKIIRGEDGNIQVIQGKRTVFNINDRSTVSMNLSCPNGHSVKLELIAKEEHDQERELVAAESAQLNA